jgi:hypothetical protein
VLCVRVITPYRRVGRCGSDGQVLQMVSDPTLMVVCTSHCVGIGCMMRGLGGAALVGGCYITPTIHTHTCYHGPHPRLVLQTTHRVHDVWAGRCGFGGQVSHHPYNSHPYLLSWPASTPSVVDRLLCSLSSPPSMPTAPTVPTHSLSTATDSHYTVMSRGATKGLKEQSGGRVR